jgi:excisionase family DNA binding protein
MTRGTGELLSPRDLARLVSVSESTLKRWIDAGRLDASRTPGGHRKIPRSEAIRLIRELGGPAGATDAIGFPEAAADASGDGDSAARDRLCTALVTDDTASAAGLIHAAFLAGRPAHELFDRLIAPVMHRIGRLWRTREDGIVIEHQATDLCLWALGRIRDALPAPVAQAAAAVGAAPTADPYLLPTQMAAIVLLEHGLRAVNLGPQTPLEILVAAAERHAARVVWLSVSTRAAAERARGDLPAFAERAARRGARLVIGGRAIGGLRSAGLAGATFGRSMAELSAFAAGMLPPAPADRAGSAPK